MSLGVGIDICVQNVVSLGLGATPEDTVQEAGRCMRGSLEETQDQRGLAFFFQKGTIAAMHCSPTSDCRSLISDPLPKCQTATLYKYFDPDFEQTGAACSCCYSCILTDAEAGCQDCNIFMETYLNQKKSRGLSRSALGDLKGGIKDLFRGLGLSFIEIESKLKLSIDNFTEDFVKTFDEVSDSTDIVKLWHVDESLADDLYSVCLEVLENCEEVDEVFIQESDSDSDLSETLDSSGVSIGSDEEDCSQ